VVGEDAQATEELKTLFDGLARPEHGREFLLNLRNVDLRGVSEQAAEEESHEFSWEVILFSDEVRPIA
jgi:hypothetical protein